MQVEIMRSVWQRARGAMFASSLEGRVLVFPYRQAGKRLFHTFFCPPLHIVALNDEMNVSFDRVVPPNRFVCIPHAKIVVEADPHTPIDLDVVRTIAQMFPYV